VSDRTEDPKGTELQRDARVPGRLGHKALANRCVLAAKVAVCSSCAYVAVIIGLPANKNT
jgi:hypothetical protein